MADVDALRGFDARTGKPVETIDLQPHGAVSLNDVDAAPDGSLYVTDPRYVFHDPEPPTRPGEDRIFRVAPDRSVSVVLQGDNLLKRPNGISWDTAGNQLLFAPLEGKPLFAWRPGETAPRVLAEGPGAYDGLEILADGRILVSSFADKGVILAFVNGAPTQLIGDLGDPANLGTDTRRRRLAIPLIESGRVEIWQLPD